MRLRAHLVAGEDPARLAVAAVHPIDAGPEGRPIRGD